MAKDKKTKSSIKAIRDEIANLVQRLDQIAATSQSKDSLAKSSACYGTLEVVCPDYITPKYTCDSNPSGIDPATGRRSANYPATPPADGIWAKGTVVGECISCRVITTTSFVKSDGTVVLQNDPAGHHPVDGKFHRL